MSGEYNMKARGKLRDRSDEQISQYSTIKMRLRRPLSKFRSISVANSSTTVFLRLLCKNFQHRIGVKDNQFRSVTH